MTSFFPFRDYRDYQKALLERLHQTSYQHFYEVLSLAYVDGFSDREIAVMLHLPLGTVKTHLTRGYRLLDRMSEEA